MTIKENEPLAPLTTFKVGGNARYFIEAINADEIKEAVLFARGKNLPFFILGGGSNILISDLGFPGLVIKISLRGISHKEERGQILVTAASGEVWDDLVAFAVERGWSGIENLSGVPGTVGGAVVQNIGCYGSEVKDAIELVSVFDISDEQIKTLPFSECRFSYRNSLFKKTEGEKYVVLSAMFHLVNSSSFKIGDAYKDNRFDIGELVKKRNSSPGLKDVREVILGVREEKGMIIMGGRESYNSAGSFFKAPIVDRELFEQIMEIASRADKEKEQRLRPWFWDLMENKIKIAPAFLLEFTEFNKGYRRGRVGVSPKHSLSIINYGLAEAREIHNLARDMKGEVKRIFGVELTPEVEYMGEF
ncbi:MAG: UDP-N-acetylmuramate dehydrogenase [Candidatus Paceibacterota bacterium]|jgi:UDP-N-acetylmuramate dehydrogenase